MEKYSKAYYVERFSGLPTDELLQKYADVNLNNEANEAIVEILAGRGVAHETLDQYKQFDDQGKVIVPAAGKSDVTSCLVVFRLLIAAVVLLLGGGFLLIAAFAGQGFGGLGGPLLLLVVVVLGLIAWAFSPLGQRNVDAKNGDNDP